MTLSERHSFLALCLPDHLVDELVEGGSLSAAPFRDHLAGELCRAIWAEAETADPRGRLFVDHALDCLVARLGVVGSKQRAQPRRSTLSPRVMKDLANYVDAHCGCDLAVSDLARIAGCRPSYFNELFRRTTGKPPYQFVIEARLERARHLLCHAADRSISEIAIDSGFSSQSHLTVAYRRAFGETPGQTRRRAAV